MPVAQLQIVEMKFPFSGISESSGIASQPDGTSPLAVNVRGYDQIYRRDRGCQRAGHSKLNLAVNASGLAIDKIVASFLGIESVAGGFNYTLTAATMIGTGTGNHMTGTLVGAFGDFNGTPPAGAGSLFVPGYFYIPNAAAQYGVSSSSRTTLNGTVDGDYFTPGSNTVGVPQSVAFSSTIAVPSGKILNWVCAVGFSDTNLNSFHYVAVEMRQAAIRVDIGRPAQAPLQSTYTISSMTFDGLPHIFSNTITPNGFTITRDAVTILNHTWTATELSHIGTWTTMVSPVITIWANGMPNATVNFYNNVSVMATGSPINTGVVGEQICYGQGGQIFCGTTSTSFQEVNTSALTNPAIAYTTGGELSIVAGYGFFFRADGVNPFAKIDAVALTAVEPSPTGGSIPTGAQLLALYRGRIFHGRFVADPFNYIASRSGDPLDYDTGALDQAGAFAGNNTQQAGLLGDTLTAMIPYGDVSMIMGMTGSIAVMRGDPKAGGSIDLLSREVGIVTPDAWARDPEGGLYFMAHDGLYVISGEATNRLDLYGGIATANPKPLSRGILDTTLGHIDFTANKVVMSWDPLELGVKIVIIPTDTTQPGTVVFWEMRKKAFWVDTIPAAMRPNAIAPLRGSGGPGGTLLVGGIDGWLRQMDPLNLTDDGSTIVSRVRYTPKQLINFMMDAKITQVRTLWGPGDINGANVNANYSLFMGNDPISASLAPADRSVNIIGGGYQSLDLQRSRGACAILEINNTQNGMTWQVEAITMMAAPSGRVRT